MFHDVPIKHGDFPVRYVNVGQRVSDGNQKNDGSFFRQCHVRHRFMALLDGLYMDIPAMQIK